MARSTRSASRALSIKSEPMDTPRRSERIRQQTPSVASDAASQTGSRAARQTRNAAADAGQVGRLTTAQASTSKAYGGPEPRASAEPESEPLAGNGPLAAFTNLFEDTRDNLVIAGSRASSVSAAPIDRRRATSAHLPDIPEGSEGSMHSARSTTSRLRAPLQEFGPAAGRAPGDPDTRPASRGSIFTKSWGDFCEAGVLAFFPPPGQPSIFRIAISWTRHQIVGTYDFLLKLSKVGAMINGLLIYIIAIALLMDMFILHRTTPTVYLRTRSTQVGQLFHDLTTTVNGSNFTYPADYGFFQRTNGQLVSLRTDVNQIQRRVGLLEENVELLEKSIPENVLLTYSTDTGRNEIPAAFWKALHDNLVQEGFGPSEQGNAPSWDEFWKKNEARVNAFLSVEVGSQLKKAMENDTIVDKPTFISMIEAQYKRLDDRVTQMDSTLPERVKIVANKWYSRNLSPSQFDLMTYAMLLDSAKIALSSVNFFSSQLGAIVDPNLSSPTQTDDRSMLRRLYDGILWIPSPYSPMTALESWEEMTDCWCAAASDSLGKAQISITMPHYIWPNKFTVEHIPKAATLDIESAPKFLEVWFDIEDEGDRERALEAYTKLVEEAGSACDESPGKNFVCAGRFHYDITSIHHVQTFALDVPFVNLAIAVKKSIVRVTENHGREWTCLYRLRMHGNMADDVNVRQTDDE